MKNYTFNDLLVAEKNVLNETKKNFPEIGYYKTLYNEFQKIFSIDTLKEYTNKSKKKPPEKYLIRTHTLKAVYSSNSILNLSLRGYYGQSYSLLRSLLEDYEHILFFYYQSPNQIKQWNEGKINRQSVRNLISKNVDIPINYRKVVKTQVKLFERLNKFVHSSRESWTAVFFIDSETEELKEKLLPVFVDGTFDIILLLLILYNVNILDFITNIYEVDLRGPEILKNLNKILDETTMYYIHPTMKKLRARAGVLADTSGVIVTE
ncbi:MAG: hypothetical protein NWE89_02790 [Candidatus Bathyarchaeota archaeon]|nr:hypothetical protein [Candidatus Bathyarchaeota archaeon]